MKDALRIYIVEDEKLVALDISNNLKLMGHEVVGISSSGEDCLEKIEFVHPDLILMDINLAGELSGIETANKINAIMNMPIVFLTAYADNKTIREVKRTGFYGYITKPFKEVDLKTEIEFTIDRFKKLLKLKKDNEATKASFKEKEKFFQQVVSSVNDIIYRIDLKGYFTFVNPSTEKETGYTKEELLDMKYTTLVRKDYVEKVYLFFKKIFQHKVENSYFELPLITKDGSEIWIGQKIHLLESKSSVIGFQVVARDITKEKVFKEQLITAKLNAENSALVKSQFLANMSHEIRTPLNGIIGVIYLLDKTELSAKQKTYINAITSSSNQLLGIINDILDLSKIESGKMDVVESEFDLYELIQSVISIFEIKSRDIGTTLSFEIDSNVPQFIYGDSVHLNQIMYNLIGNAMKFTENGAVQLKISLTDDSEDYTELQFCVSDSGIGMSESVIEKIFDSFTQAEVDTTRKFGGTGLGLAIVKKLVDLQDGTITVKSETNHGSTFTINLKYKKVLSQKVIKVKSTTENFSQLDKLKVLLVEDNPINQLVTKDLLMEQGSEIEVANNGKIALEILKNKTFDIILMDMQMPIMDGYQTMHMIRESDDEKLKNIPIIALTAYAIDTEIEKCFNCGANDYLSKPYKPESLYQKICDLLTPLENIKIEEEFDFKKNGYEEHLNIKTLEEFTNGKVELIQTTLNELKIAFENDFVLLKNAVKNQDSQIIKSIAHKIKPNFMLVGLNRMGQTCNEVEHALLEAEMNLKVDEILNAIPKIILEINEFTHTYTLQKEEVT